MGSRAALAKTPRNLLSPEQWTEIGHALRLSNRELDVIQCIFDELTEAQTAKALGVRANTVHTYHHRLYGKLGVHSRAGVVVSVMAEVMRNGLSQSQSARPG